MPQTTVTLGVEIDAEPDTVFGLLRDPANIPLWAPLFAEAVAFAVGDRWTAVKEGRAFSLRAAVNGEALCVDYLREIAPGREGGAYLRVLPRPAGGSVAVMTLPVTPGASVDQVSEVLRDELGRLARLAEGGRPFILR